MKLEMLESAAYSWLRHKKRCKVVQLNWKASPLWGNSIDEIPGFHDKIETVSKLLAKDGIKLFKKGTVEQLIKQAEIDVLGLDDGDNSSGLYAVECAFHEGGLNYGSKEETRDRVVKKLFRSVVVTKLYFPRICETRFFFVSPRINPTTFQLVKDGIDKLATATRTVGWDASYSLLANEEFSIEIMCSLHDYSSTVTDTSELFLRSLQLYKLSESVPPEIQTDAEQDGDIETRAVEALINIEAHPEDKNEAFPITLNPEDREKFLKNFKGGIATITIKYEDESSDTKMWKHKDLVDSSKIIGNIRSKSYLRPDSKLLKGRRIRSVVVHVPKKVAN